MASSVPITMTNSKRACEEAWQSILKPSDKTPKILGQGGFGVVFELNGYAVKVQSLKGYSFNGRMRYMTPMMESNFNTEIQTFILMKDKDVTPILYDHWIDEDFAFIIMQKMDGDLNDLIKLKHWDRFDIKYFITQLNHINDTFLHNWINVGDLQPHNVLFHTDGEDIKLKVGDLGTSQAFGVDKIDRSKLYMKAFDESMSLLKSKLPDKIK